MHFVRSFWSSSFLFYVSFFFTLSLTSLHGLEIKLNYGKEDKDAFAVLNLKHEYPFSCEAELKITGDVKEILCRVVGIPKTGLNPTKSSMLTFNYYMEEKKADSEKRAMIIQITPMNGVKLQLFSVFSDLKTEKPIPVTRKTQSKSYQIVAYYKKLPFLKPEDNIEKRDSINFPVAIPKTSTPTINELDINRKPLDYIAGKDLDLFLEIKDLMHKHEYTEALDKISAALKAFPDSLFAKDMVYYTIVALDKTQNNPESITYLINAATPWIKAYASDDKVPEVMYILAKTFAQQNKLKEAHYYLNRLTDEYPNSRYWALAKMQLANMLKAQSDIKRAPLIYRDAYKGAKDLDVAAEVAESWARFSLRNGDPEFADELLGKIFSVFPSFFLINKEGTMEFIADLEDQGQYKNAAKLAYYLSGYVPPQDESHELLLNKASDFYAKVGNFDMAHKINLEFLHYHPTSKFAPKIRERDNSLLFEVSGDYNAKLARYDYILEHYPNTENAKKALEFKARLYFDHKEYEKVIEMQPLLESDYPTLQNAIDKQILISLEERNCVAIAGILSKANKVNLTVTQSLDVFECLYNQASFQKAHDLFSTLNKHIKDGENQLRWLYLEANTLFALGKNKLALQAGKDVIDLAFAMGKHEYYDISFKMFNALYNNESTRHEAIILSTKMDTWFPDDKRMIPVHFTLLNEAQYKKDALALKTEARIVMALQEKAKDYTYSPYVNFIYINSLIDEEKYNEALRQLNAIKEFDLSIEDKQQRYYKIATINYTLKNMEVSKKALEACISFGTTTAWGTLCNNAMSLHNNSLE